MMLVQTAFICSFLARSAVSWQLGRATYFGAPAEVSRAYDPTRGDGSFGIIQYGACGYTNAGGRLPFPIETYAAMADQASEYPGSCGRCYEIRCKSGLVLGNGNQPIKLVYHDQESKKVGFFDGDWQRPYLASINPSVKDTKGRMYPGNPAERDAMIYTSCYDENQTIRVRIGDSCPCKQVLPDGAPGVRKGGETRRQEWCCGPIQHFDLSYWAFEKLAHPVSGAMMLEYRPVDCETGMAISGTYISPVIYSFRGIEPGWAWMPHRAVTAELMSATAPFGGVSTCVKLAEGGDVTFRSRDADRDGFQPFKDKSQMHLWIKNNWNTSQVNPLKVFVTIDKDGGNMAYCFKEVQLQSLRPVATNNGWKKFKIDLSQFGCDGALDKTRLNRVDFQHIGKGETDFCMTGLELL